jgi:hypothetical protein
MAGIVVSPGLVGRWFGMVTGAIAPYPAIV